MRCPTCNNSFELESSSAKPFCSVRCRLIDLGHWLDESYALPHVADPEEDEVPDDHWAGDNFTDAEEPTDV